jgi:hypothetical protein
MRTVTYERQKIRVEILSLAFPPTQRLLLGVDGERPHLAFLSPVEIPLGVSFSLENAEEQPLQARTLACAKNSCGRYLVVGCIGQ